MRSLCCDAVFAPEGRRGPYQSANLDLRLWISLLLQFVAIRIVGQKLQILAIGVDAIDPQCVTWIQERLTDVNFLGHCCKKHR